MRREMNLPEVHTIDSVSEARKIHRRIVNEIYELDQYDKNLRIRVHRIKEKIDRELGIVAT